MPQPLPPDPIPQRVVARIINFYGIQVGLLAAQPNWDTEIKVSMELPTDVSKEPITFSESRRNFAQSARYKMEWTSYLSDAAASTELRIFLQSLKDNSNTLNVVELPIFVPLWPDVCEIKNAITRGQRQIVLVDLPARYSAAWIITDENFTTWEIVVISALNILTKTISLPTGGITRQGGYPAGTLAYPLLAGRLEEQPQPESITDETIEVGFKVKENSGFSARLSPAASTVAIVGPSIPVFQTLPKWTFAPNHVRPMDWTEMPDVVYEHVGFMRQEQQRAYDHDTPRGQELEFYQSDRASIASIEYFWRDRRATTLRFMIPTYRGDLRMSADTPVPGAGHEKWIKCERSFFSNPGRRPLSGDNYIALIDKTDSVQPYQLSAAIDVQPSETRLVTTINTHVHKAATTIVSHLLLARFAEPTLEWTYTTPYLGTTRIKFREVVMEYPNNIVPVPPPPLPEPAFLFLFTEVGIRVDRFTSYENTITIPQAPPPAPVNPHAGTYTPAPFSFDTVKVGLKLDQEKLELKSWKFDGNPLNKMWPFALDGILNLEIIEVNVRPNDPTQPPFGLVTRFYGDVWSIDSTYKAQLIPFGNLFDRKFPRFVLSVSDNNTAFSPPFVKTASAFVIHGTIHGTVSHTSQTLLVTSTAGHGKVSNYFAGGWLETGTGVNKEKRGILFSAASGTTDVSLTIDRPLLKANANQPLDFYPGYDGSIEQCDTKFTNRENFGGHPYIPNVNPGVKAIKPKETAGGKKG